MTWRGVAQYHTCMNLLYLANRIAQLFFQLGKLVLNFLPQIALLGVFIQFSTQRSQTFNSFHKQLMGGMRNWGLNSTIILPYRL